MDLPSTWHHPVDQSLIPERLSEIARPRRRILELLKKGSKTALPTGPKSWSLDFCLSPHSFDESSKSPGQIGSVSFEKTKLDLGPFARDTKAIGTGKIVDVPAQLAFRSIGYKSEGLPGFRELKIPFDNKLGIIPNDGEGRVVYDTGGMFVSQLPGLYCAGWVKRGPTGVIASTMTDAFATADAIAKDWHLTDWPFLGDLPEGNVSGLGWDGLEAAALDHGCRRVSWKDWKQIDSVERARGRANGKIREKFTSIKDMLAVLG